MANDAIFIGWSTVVRGREQKALEVFQETVQFWTQAQQDGRIQSVEPILLEPHGGDLAGFMLIRGERAQLDQIRASDEFRRIVARASAIVDGVGVVSAYGDETLARQLSVFQEAANDLA
jgi:hypothetical protein